MDQLNTKLTISLINEFNNVVTRLLSYVATLSTN